METPVEAIAALNVGTVQEVSPAKITVLLDVDAPQATALNTGTPQIFPKVNGYVLIPVGSSAVVGLVIWLGIEQSTYPKRPGLRDFGLIDLPFPLRKLTVTPIGTLTPRTRSGTVTGYHFARGIAVFPSVGDPVKVPTVDQLRALIEVPEELRRIQIGTAPLAANAPVFADPNRLFGRHLAILGNTGSGKSCSVAGLVRWSLESASAAKIAGKETVNARFIVLDPNGEYEKAFADLGDRVRLFRVPPVELPVHRLEIPAWMWNSKEWLGLLLAAPGAQRPALLDALRRLRSGAALELNTEERVAHVLNSSRRRLALMLDGDGSDYQEFPRVGYCGGIIEAVAKDAAIYAKLFKGSQQKLLEKVAQQADSIWKLHKNNAGYFSAFNENELRTLVGVLSEGAAGFKGREIQMGVDEDTPVPFDPMKLPAYLESAAVGMGGLQYSTLMSGLVARTSSMLSDKRLGSMINPQVSPSLQAWLEDYLGVDGGSNGQVAVLDLSLVPAEVMHTVVAVIARLVFEALQRYRRLHKQELPTVLVLDEAHNFLRILERPGFDVQSPERMCVEMFEKISREGRKFGLGLVVASQRPSEVSPTVISQCNTFLIHRIVNDQDQRALSRLVPDSLAGLLTELPSLPTQQAILLGWAAPLPLLVDMNELPKSQQPDSADPHFWEVWVGSEERSVDWKADAEDWAGPLPTVAEKIEVTPVSEGDSKEMQDDELPF